ncbi:MAG: transglutaminase-like domain-containing protein, partial [Spirochaetales bacterium]|nr:transglutaminase-like domain-containing protein [Spirochaetales bacterium]
MCFCLCFFACFSVYSQITITIEKSYDTSDPPEFNAETLTRAMNDGDCGFLFQYIEQGKEKTDARLVSRASAVMKRYTALDSGTAQYRTNLMESRVRSVPKDLAEKVFVEPEIELPDLVKFLAAGINDQFRRAKTLHDWICDNISYDTETYFGKTYRDQAYVSVLKNKTAVCAGYSALFNTMCGLAGLESMTISG